MVATVQHLVRSGQRVVARMVQWAVIKGVSEQNGLLTAQLEDEDGHSTENAVCMGWYGLASVPREQSEVVVVQLEADAAHPIVLACEDRRYRVRGLVGGEVAVYNDAGARIVLRANGEIAIVGNVRIEGTLSAQEVADAGGALSQLRARHDQHMHDVIGMQTTPPLEP